MKGGVLEKTQGTVLSSNHNEMQQKEE